MGLSFSGTRPCCCRNNVLHRTDDGEVVIMTAGTAITWMWNPRKVISTCPRICAWLRGPRRPLRSNRTPSRHTHRRTPGGFACPATQFPPPMSDSE
ncbi:myristylated tegument protein [Human alphaherpesvirus 1]|nr:myristylated tegument protein [Human alphaherpesvirus 1]